MKKLVFLLDDCFDNDDLLFCVFCLEENSGETVTDDDSLLTLVRLVAMLTLFLLSLPLIVLGLLLGAPPPLVPLACPPLEDLVMFMLPNRLGAPDFILGFTRDLELDREFGLDLGFDVDREFGLDRGSDADREFRLVLELFRGIRFWSFLLWACESLSSWHSTPLDASTTVE